MNLHDLAARTALVLETNNLRGGADLAKVAGSLTRLFEHLKGQSLALSRLALPEGVALDHIMQNGCAVTVAMKL